MPAQTKRANAEEIAEDYLAEFGDDDDPFRRTPSPSPGKQLTSKGKSKAKPKDALGIDQEIDLKKKPRVPTVKLDETRLLSDNGIPKLRKMAPKLRFKGKGHEFSDAARILSFYQEWLDDLFPKANFLDALAMVEKAGHKTTIRNARLKWIDETRPKPAVEDEFPIYQTSKAPEPTRIAPIFEARTQDGFTTPANDDLFGDDDIYNATPKAKTNAAPARDVPDDDDLDALMAEAEMAAGEPSVRLAPASTSIFGGGPTSKSVPVAGEPDEDELDALMAEAESLTEPLKPAGSFGGSIFGNGNPKPAGTAPKADYDDGDLDALMREAEGFGSSNTNAKEAAINKVNPPKPGGAVSTDIQDVDEDLDALMAEAEAESLVTPASKNDEGAVAKPAQPAQGPLPPFDDDEAAMAEMEGLW